MQHAHCSLIQMTVEMLKILTLEIVRMSSHNLRIVIDGNIGSGKTTQLKMLSDIGFTVQCEPIDEWPLEQFYEDKHRWAFLLQMSILRSFVKHGKSSDVWERSPESSKDVFWKMLRSEEIGTDDEDTVYTFFTNKMHGNQMYTFTYAQTQKNVSGDFQIDIKQEILRFL